LTAFFTIRRLIALFARAFYTALRLIALFTAFFFAAAAGAEGVIIDIMSAIIFASPV